MGQCHVFRGMRKPVYGTVIAYVLLSVFFFLPVSIPHKIVFPLLVLSVSAFGNRLGVVTCGFFFSAIGDYMGSVHDFMLQMSFFALAHISFVVYFLRMPDVRKRMMWNARLYGRVVLFALLYGVLGGVILCHIGDKVMQIGVGVYVFLILSFLFLTTYAVPMFFWGALLFVLSDFILGWNKFVFHIPCSSYCILVPYFSAQLLLFLGGCRRRCGVVSD